MSRGIRPTQESVNRSTRSCLPRLQVAIHTGDQSLKGLGAVLSQKGEDREIHIIAYASCSMRDCSSTKIKLMALKWSVCDKFKDYLLGSKFTVFTDYNPLCFIKSSIFRQLV